MTTNQPVPMEEGSHFLHAWDSDGELTRFTTIADCATYWRLLALTNRLPVWKTLADYLPTIGREERRCSNTP